MGECAEMVLDGILDWDGSYSGNNETRFLLRNNERLFKVLKLLQSMGVKKDNRYPFIMEYGATIDKATCAGLPNTAS